MWSTRVTLLGHWLQAVILPPVEIDGLGAPCPGDGPFGIDTDRGTVLELVANGRLDISAWFSLH